MRIGIVLGGGGIKCFAHLGVLQALEEAGIRPDILSSSSSGSIVGAFIASGKTPLEIHQILKKFNFLDIAAISLPKAGIFTLDNLELNLKKQLTVSTFEELKIPLYVSVSNLYSGKVEYINSGQLALAVKAACALPFVFAPVKMGGQLYIDGGLLDDLPYTPLQGRCDKIITINITRVKQIDKLDGFKDMALRVIELIVDQDSENAKRHSDVFIEPPGMQDFRMFDTRHGDELFQIGYDYAKKMMDI